MGCGLFVANQNMLYVILPKNGIVDMQKGTARYLTPSSRNERTTISAPDKSSTFESPLACRPPTWRAAGYLFTARQRRTTVVVLHQL